MSHLDARPPEWFFKFFATITGHYTAWVPRPETPTGYWIHLHQYPPNVLARALSIHIGRSKYAPTVAELREIADRLQKPERLLALTPGEAWDEMYRNRHRVDRRKPVVWSSPAVERAARVVNWDDPEWLSEQIPTIRAQFERAYSGMSNKADAIEKHAEAELMLEGIDRLLGGGVARLYGADYKDPKELSL